MFKKLLIQILPQRSGSRRVTALLMSCVCSNNGTFSRTAQDRTDYGHRVREDDARTNTCTNRIEMTPNVFSVMLWSAEASIETAYQGKNKLIITSKYIKREYIYSEVTAT
jgi:hypothetical protein